MKPLPSRDYRTAHKWLTNGRNGSLARSLYFSSVPLLFFDLASVLAILPGGTRAIVSTAASNRLPRLHHMHLHVECHNIFTTPTRKKLMCKAHYMITLLVAMQRVGLELLLPVYKVAHTLRRQDRSWLRSPG